MIRHPHRTPPVTAPTVALALIAASCVATAGLGLIVAGVAAGLVALCAAAIVALGALVVRDRRAVRRLAESERSLGQAQRLTGIGSFTTDLRTGQTTCSAELYRILGVDPETPFAPGDALLALVHEDDRDRVESTVRAAIAGLRDWSFVQRIVTADGRVRMLECRGAVEADASGRPARIVGTGQDVTERELAADALSDQASHDPLTGLPNRSLFLDRLDRALARSRRSDAPLAVVFLDLDDFKLVNDTRGHDEGDQLLLALAPQLSAALRPGDTIARFGGDEFVVLCEDLSSGEDAVRIAERTVEACGRPITIQGHRHQVTVSAGVAIARGLMTTGSELLRDADAAMYRAKEAGKGRIEVFDDGMRVRMIERVGIEAGLRRALDYGELRLLYQPVVSLSDGRIAGVEALLRWDHPERGLLEPAEFMGVAETTGLIVPIGRWAIGEACRQAAAWRRRDPGGPPVHVSVNLSRRQLLSSDVAADVAASLSESGLEPSLLALEVEEHLLLEDPATCADALERLAKLGVRVVIDGFGSGYSSLSHLSRMTIDSVKIDRSLVDGILRRPEEEGAMVEAVLSLAEALDVGVTAGGVETAGQLSRLRAQGCEFAQGYLFSRPASAERLDELLRRARGERSAA